MFMSITEFLQLLARREGYLRRRRGQGNILLQESDGRDMEITDDQGRQVEPILPTAIFEDFLDAGLVRQDDQDESTVGSDFIYRLTADGRMRGTG